MVAFAWTLEIIERLKQLHAKGYTASEKQRILHAPTRNVICGMQYRLGLKRTEAERKVRFKAGGRKTGKANLARSLPLKSRRAKAGKVSKAVLGLSPADVPSLPPLNLPLEDLQANQCRYPYGEQAPFQFCGHPTAEGTSWCSHHLRVVSLQ